MKPKCRHCGKEAVTRPRGLCWKCYYSPARDLYPESDSKFARRGVGNGVAPSRPPAAPCPHQPGSEERLRTLEARAAAGESMRHPGDNRGDLA